MGGDFPFRTINGKTGEASGGTMNVREGDLVRMRVYNASNREHAMHMHGHDITIVSRNGHLIPKRARQEITTFNISSGDFVELEFRARNPGNWIFHCHVPHHTSNTMLSGYNGSPIGMTRIVHYEGSPAVPPAYFAFAG